MSTTELPINEYDALTLAIEGTSALFGLCSFPIALWLFYKERESAYIKYRGFWNCIYAQFGCIVTSFGISIPVLFNAPCWIFPLFTITGSLCMGFLFFEKALLLYVTHTIARTTKEIVRNEGHNSWQFEHRAMLLDPSPFSFTKKVVFGLSLMSFMIVVGITFGVFPEAMSHPWYTEECLTSGVKMVLVMNVMMGVSMAPVGFMMQKLSKVEDNYFLMFELNSVQPLMGIMGILGILYVIIPNVRQVYQRPVLLQYVACAFLGRVMAFFSSVVIVFKNRRHHLGTHSQKDSQRNNSSLNLHNNNSHDHPSVVELRNSSPPSPAGSDGRPASPSSPSNKVRATTEKLRQILSTEDGFTAFEKFLVKELSTENLHCWKAVEVLRARYLETDPSGNEGLWKNAQRIYDLFGHEKATVPVNISSQARLRLEGLFADGCKYDPAVFPDIIKALSAVQDELYLLMSMDSFRRFRRSEEYKILKVEAEEV
jgi:hypothetical protein